jgi:hypothetical protein
MALKEGSHLMICVLTRYYLKPSRMSSFMRMSGRRGFLLVVAVVVESWTRPRAVHVTFPI